MPEISKELRLALESIDSTNLDAIIRKKKKEDLDALIQLVSMDPSIESKYRTRSIYALGRWGDPKSVEVIGRVLPKLDEIGKVTAIDSLGRLGTKEALDLIFDYRTDQSTHVRKFVTNALARIDLPKSRIALEEIKEKDSEPYIRSLASMHLTNLASK
jgi:HEAT repeat protein